MERKDLGIGPVKIEQIQGDDGRAQWERPSLRRLMANEAESSNMVITDGRGGMS